MYRLQFFDLLLYISFFFQESSEKVFEAYKNKPVTVNDFIETLMSDPGPTCLAWLPLLHRIGKKIYYANKTCYNLL